MRSSRMGRVHRRPLPSKWKVAERMIGRRLSPGGGEEVVGEVGMGAVLTAGGSTAIKSDPCFSAD